MSDPYAAWADEPVRPRAVKGPPVEARAPAADPFEGWTDEPVAAPPQPSTLEAVGEGVKQGGTLGFGHRYAGLVAGQLDKAAGAINGAFPGSLEWAGVPKSFESDPNAGEEARQNSQAVEDAAAEAHPTAHFVGQLAGGLAVPMPGGLGGAVATGALGGFGSSRSDTLGGQAMDTLSGGAGGALGYGAGKVVGKVLSPLSPLAERAQGALKRLAELRAAKAGGLIGKDIGRVGTDEAAAMGREVLNRGGVRFGDRTEDVAKRLEAIRPQVGKEIGDVVGELDRARASLPPGAAPGLTPSALAGRIEKGVLPDLQRFPADRAAAAKVAEEAARLRAIGRKPLSFQAASELKGSYDPMAKWSAVRPPEEGAIADKMRDFQGMIRRGIDEEAQRVSPELAAKYQAARRSYSLLKPAEDIAEKRAGQLEGNRWMSPSDYGVGSVGALGGMLAGGPVGSVMAGAASGLAHKVLRERGAASVAVTADALQKAIGSGAFGRFGQKLTSLAARGLSLPVAHAYLLKSDPGYAAAAQEALAPQE